MLLRSVIIYFININTCALENIISKSELCGPEATYVLVRVNLNPTLSKVQTKNHHALLGAERCHFPQV